MLPALLKKLGRYKALIIDDIGYVQQNREEMEVIVGDIVLFTKYGGTEIKIDEKEYKILSIRDILAVIEQ